jgi:2',3'-cyclic-nucleotide 2'-phosphodiesterase (5'-nucleotidase family)
MKSIKPNRRNFLKNAALLSWSVPASFVGNDIQQLSNEFSKAGQLSEQDTADSFTLLITTDIHAQLHTHDEFFWQHGKAVYKKRGGLAVLKTMIDRLRKNNPRVILYDGGDSADECFSV